MLTLSSLQANRDTFVNSVEPDETALDEQSHQALHCLPFCYWFLTENLLQQWLCPNSEMEESISDTQECLGSGVRKFRVDTVSGYPSFL